MKTLTKARVRKNLFSNECLVCMWFIRFWVKSGDQINFIGESNFNQMQIKSSKSENTKLFSNNKFKRPLSQGWVFFGTLLSIHKLFRTWNLPIKCSVYIYRFIFLHFTEFILTPLFPNAFIIDEFFLLHSLHRIQFFVCSLNNYRNHQRSLQLLFCALCTSKAILSDVYCICVRLTHWLCAAFLIFNGKF